MTSTCPTLRHAAERMLLLSPAGTLTAGSTAARRPLSAKAAESSAAEVSPRRAASIRVTFSVASHMVPEQAWRSARPYLTSPFLQVAVSQARHAAVDLDACWVRLDTAGAVPQACQLGVDRVVAHRRSQQDRLTVIDRLTRESRVRPTRTRGTRSSAASSSRRRRARRPMASGSLHGLVVYRLRAPWIRSRCAPSISPSVSPWTNRRSLRPLRSASKKLRMRG